MKLRHIINALHTRQNLKINSSMLLTLQWGGFNQAEPASFCWTVWNRAGVTLHPSTPTLPRLSPTLFLQPLGAPALKGNLSRKIACIFPHQSVDRWTLTVAFPLLHIRSLPPPHPPPPHYLLSAFLWHSSPNRCFVEVQCRLYAGSEVPAFTET